MDFGLRNKTAVVTGGGSGGIGQAVAMALAREGVNVVVNDIARDEQGRYRADVVAEDILKMGGRAVANHDSVASREGAENMIRTAVDRFGRIDILVNCAGNFHFVPTLDITEENWNSVLSVHLGGHFHCCKAALPEMVRQRSGRIINFSSRAAFGVGGNLAYTSAKAAILGMTAMLAGEFREHGITVNAVLPSADTKLFPGPRPKGVKSTMPEPLSIEPEFIAPVVAYLASDHAGYLTGQFIYVSGGDICLFPKSFQIPMDSPVFLRKPGKWTMEELAQVLPSVVDAGSQVISSALPDPGDRREE